MKKEITEKYGKEMEFEGIKKTEEKNIHITLLFLGYFAEEKIDGIKEKVKGIKQEKIKIRVKGTGSFNSRIIFLNIQEGEKEVKELHEKLCNALEIRDERFKVHATIARNKKAGRKEFESIMNKLEEIEFEKEITIKSFELMESALLPSGPKYKKIFSVELE